ncbi:MAG: isoprenylcysteine carboxylmethyltransferase family protein [Xanthomonadales bacterium]
MKQLELTLPPVAVTVLYGVAMWGIAHVAPPQALPKVLTFTAAALFTIGSGVVGIAGIVAFRRAGTTVNPLQPGNSSALVVDGIYGYTRNPMYLALLMLLFAWGIALSNPWSMLFAWTFIPYMNRFQIGPEERAMARRFGADFLRYAARVRRWI